MHPLSFVGIFFVDAVIVAFFRLYNVSKVKTHFKMMTANAASSNMYFAPSSASTMNGLASDLSEMAIGDRPPPRKIRRRNALTPKDPHYPYLVPPPNSPVHDPFEDSSRLQALDEIVHRDFALEDGSSCSSVESLSLYSSDSHDAPKRKLAGGRRLCGPRLPGEDREVCQILLHKDLENFKPEASLPELLIRKYVKACKSSLHNPCSTALVPWTPPDKMLSDILCKDSENQKSPSPPAASSCPSDSNMDTE